MSSLSPTSTSGTGAMLAGPGWSREGHKKADVGQTHKLGLITFYVYMKIVFKIEKFDSEINFLLFFFPVKK